MNFREWVAEIVDHVRGMWRYRWWAAALAWVLAVAGWFYVYSIPDIYRASAQVYVDTMGLLRPLMAGLTVAPDTLNEAQLVSRAVLTRPNLERIVHETDLALGVTDQQSLEGIITGLQASVRITGSRDNIFTIQYEHANRDKARDVVAAVLETFVASAIGNQGTDADVTERALANEIQVHEQRLSEADARLARFKQDNLGFMPDEYGDYYNRLEAAIAKVSEAEDKLRVATQRRDELQRQIEGEAPVFGIMPAPNAGAGCSQGAQIQSLEQELAQLRVNFTERHPRLISLQETIDYLLQQCAAENARLGGNAGRASAQQLDSNPVFQNLRIQLSNVELDLATQRAELDTRQQEVSRLRRDVDRITNVEAQLKQLNRDYNVIQTRHQELIRRWEDLQAKKRLDPVTDTIAFRRIEPPFADADPVGPNRPMLLFAVLFVAIGASGALAFGLNQLHPAFFTRRGLGRVTDLPVLGSISMIRTPAALRKLRLDAAAWATAYILLVICNIGLVAFAAAASGALRALLES